MGIVIPDGGNIGSASDTDAISISSGGNVTLSQTLDGGAIGSAVTMSANQACVKTALNASGSAPIFACRAWVNFNGTGTVAINSSSNISSISDEGTGKYKLNFTNSMPDANYCATFGGCMDDVSASVGYRVGIATASGVVDVKTTTQLEIQCKDQSGTPTDLVNVNVAVFG